nr:hypothetical protein [Nostoc sp. CreGUA01]
MGRWGDGEMGRWGDERDEGDGEVGRWGKSNSSFPPSPHPLLMPNAQYSMTND